MRTTTLLVSLALLGLVAVPSASAASSEALNSPEIPCEPSGGGNTIDDTLNLARAAYCLVRPFVQSELDNVNEDVNSLLGAIDPFVQAAKDICANHAGDRCNILDSAIDVTIDPNFVNVDDELDSLLSADAGQLEFST